VTSRRFLVVDLGGQISDQRRFAVWDTTVSRFWKINGHQTWAYVDEIVDDFKRLLPEKKFQDVFLRQRDEIAEQAFGLGFDRELMNEEGKEPA
jgi:hypothetical protein